MSASDDTPRKLDFKYKIGKVRQTPPVLKDPRTGLEYIELKARQNERVYGVTKFAGHYKEEKKLGQGTFGEVYRGIHLETQRQVAMKRIIVKAENDLFPITAQREITILRRLDHKNVIKLIEMVYDTPPNANKDTTSVPQAQPAKSFYMILPYMVADLSGILHNPRIELQMRDIKNMMLQLLEGINYIHCKKFMHRDIKAANILIDHKGVLKIADFGLARNYYGAPPNLKYPGGAGLDAKYTSVVVTRWYRAPELVLGDKNYTTAVDMWGVGCVFVEFFEKKPILQGASDIDQGHVIFKLVGTPDDEEWPLAKYLPGSELTRTSYPSTLNERFDKYLDGTGLDLLSKLLALDPYKRLTAMAASKHQFFSQDPLPTETLNLPCEESHEADIKRYKQELNQSMTQQPPPAPQGHILEKSTTPGAPQLVQLPRGPKADRTPLSGPSEEKNVLPRISKYAPPVDRYNDQSFHRNHNTYNAYHGNIRATSRYGGQKSHSTAGSRYSGGVERHIPSGPRHRNPTDYAPSYSSAPQNRRSRDAGNPVTSTYQQERGFRPDSRPLGTSANGRPGSLPARPAGSTVEHKTDGAKTDSQDRDGSKIDDKSISQLQELPDKGSFKRRDRSKSGNPASDNMADWY